MKLTSAELWVIWNLFLAAIPVVLAQVIVWMATRPKRNRINNLGIVLAGLVWLAFLPNTCYLLTEWRHFLMTLDMGDLYINWRLNREMTARLMMYTTFYFCYSGIGMLAFTLALRPMVKLAAERIKNVWLLGIPLFLMLSIGVYLGLVLRYNSWDLVHRPSEVAMAVAAITDRSRLTALTMGFAGFLWLAYLAIDIWIDGFLARWNKLIYR